MLGNYTKKNSEKIKIKHNVCNETWEIRPNNFLNLENRCPHCRKLESKSIRRIKKILKEKDIKFECEKSLQLQRLRDIIKNNWIMENKYSLIRIDYTMIRYLDDILEKIIDGSSTTISRELNLFYIESGDLINNNEKISRNKNVRRYSLIL